MKKLGIIIILFIFFGSQNAYNQNSEPKTKDQKKLEKQNQKAAKKKQAEAEWYLLKDFLEDTNFVFQGELFSGGSIDPKINFVVIKKDQAVIQFANGFGGGQNGIGGFTIDGIIEKYQVKSNKVGKAISVDITVMPRQGSGFGGPVNVILSAFSYDSVRLNINSKVGVMEGKIKREEDSKIFKGNTPN